MFVTFLKLDIASAELWGSALVISIIIVPALCQSEFQILFVLIKAEINPVPCICIVYPLSVSCDLIMWTGMDYIRTILSRSIFTPRFLKQIQTLKRKRKPLPSCQSYLHFYLHFWFWFRIVRAKTNKLSFTGNLWHLSTDFSIVFTTHHLLCLH